MTLKNDPTSTRPRRYVSSTCWTTLATDIDREESLRTCSKKWAPTLCLISPWARPVGPLTPVEQASPFKLSPFSSRSQQPPPMLLQPQVAWSPRACLLCRVHLQLWQLPKVYRLQASSQLQEEHQQLESTTSSQRLPLFQASLLRYCKPSLQSIRPPSWLHFKVQQPL